MPKPMSDMCFGLARIARGSKNEMLAYILRLAGHEALARRALMPDGIQDFAGTWDWDVTNDLNYLCPTGAELFGKDAIAAAGGLPNAAYVQQVHSDDVVLLNEAVSRALTSGGPFEAKYRVVARDRVRWISASGNAVADRVGRIMRFQGVMFNISSEPVEHHRSLNS